jgi:hypothetical protein
VLQQGLIRRIGDGQSTKIWYQNWLPRDFMLKPIVANCQDPPEMVSELMDQVSGSWDFEKINATFIPMDAQIIGNIPISLVKQSDVWAWHYEKRGNFSVRSAYQMIIETKLHRENWFDARTGGSDSTNQQKQWCSLWKTKVPSKVKVFAWGLARSSLPTSDVLNHRGMATVPSCAMCGATDSWRHSLIDCNMARSVWALLDEDLVEHISVNQVRDPRQWLFFMQESLKHSEFIQILVTLWVIWKARRKAIHEDIFESPISSLGFITRFITDLDAAFPSTNCQAPRPPLGRAPARWLPPVTGMVKINCDGAVARDGRRGSVAAVCRNGDGLYLGASVRIIEGLVDPATL